MEEELERYRKALQEIVALGPTLRRDINEDRLHQVYYIAQRALLHKDPSTWVNLTRDTNLTEVQFGEDEPAQYGDKEE